MRRGAFTLLEVVIVVALVVAISAVALPSLASRVTAGQAGHAVLCVESAVSMTRAEAMKRGVLMSLVAEQAGEEWILFARAVAPARAGADSGGAEGAEFASPAAPPGDPGREVASFTGVVLTDILPEVEQAGALGDIPPDPLDPASGFGPVAGPDAPPGALTIGTFFPDGSCRAPAPLYMLARDGARQILRLRPLSGRLDVRALPTAGEEAARLDQADDADTLVPVEGEAER